MGAGMGVTDLGSQSIGAVFTEWESRENRGCLRSHEIE